MAFHYNNDNVYVDSFTPREYQVELLDRVKNRNTIVCSSTSFGKAFIALKLVQELSWQMRKACGSRVFYILDSQNLNVLLEQLKLLTDLNCMILDRSITKIEWVQMKEDYHVFLMTVDGCLQFIANTEEDFSYLTLLIIDDGLYGEKQYKLNSIMDVYDKTVDKPRVLGLVSGLLGEDLKPAYLNAEILRLENLLRSTVDTSSEIVTQIRLSSKPKEIIMECVQSVENSLQTSIRETVLDAITFLTEHRYDPSEIYAEEFLEEIRNVPDPKEKPLMLLHDFLALLEELGSWCANQAALHILVLVEKLKVKVAYERHYLLLCVLSTKMMQIRAMCEAEMEDLEDEKQRILCMSTHKVLRFIEVLREMGPPESEKPVEPVNPPVVDVVPHPPKFGKRQYKGQRRNYYARPNHEDSICALVFVKNSCTARVIHSLLSSLAQCDNQFWWIGTLFTVDKIADPITEPNEAELEHRKQEDVLRKFRSHDCNVMISTAILEQGFDLPKCNLVIRFDMPGTFHSYVQSKSRARSQNPYYITLVCEVERKLYLQKYAEYMEVEKTLLMRCGMIEYKDEDVRTSDQVCNTYAPYKTAQNETVSLTTAIPLINRYCAKLPSDTFTKLVPTYDFVKAIDLVACKLRLPINSPVKATVCSPFVSNDILARRHAAFYMCQLLHKYKELDDNLNPITKENFRATEEDWNDFSLEKEDEELSLEHIEQRPGTTKRRQYYYKRIAFSLQDCLPYSNKSTYFYRIVMTLTCPIPEEQNTRGRRIYPPEESAQGFGILTCKEIPQLCPFPIFTRSGEVKISLELCNEGVNLSEEQLHKISEFLNYTFTSVLRLQKYQMLFDPKHTDSSYYIVPTITDDEKTDVDWDFLNKIYQNRDVLPESIPDENRANYEFDPAKYKDAVVMPWYRNQDQPQYFYVAEICSNLNPTSTFPGSEYSTFQEYYLRKYNLDIQNADQHLLDVDHTSARLNFLTPRYVNRKGVALPTSSEETKKAKRENLEQKQILVPELCAIHPFPASLWRKAVCLPCILYRINALLLADEIRRTVAEDIHLGKPILPRSFNWPSLNFGWCLSDVLKKSKENELSNDSVQAAEEVLEDIILRAVSISEEKVKEEELDIETIERNSDDPEWIEIGTWSNDMVGKDQAIKSTVRYGSPTSWMHSTYGYNEYDDFSDTDSYYSEESEGETNDSQCGGLHIEFQGEYLAEAVDNTTEPTTTPQDYILSKAWETEPHVSEQLESDFIEACEGHITIMNTRMVLKSNEPFKMTGIQINDRDLIKVENDNQKSDNYNFERKTVETIPNIRPKPQLTGFSFDKQPNLEEHPGPSPSVILQALTMSNANDGINLERLETIGDSFLKYAITDYLYSKYEYTHEGKLSHLRSKQVSNLNLYRLGKRKQLGDMMIATKFDPHDNWLPPCYCVSKELEEALSKARIPANYLTLADYVATRNMSLQEICLKIQEQGESVVDFASGIIPYNLVTQHSIPDKSIADCVEALIGAYLIECGPRGALLFMAWLGIRVLPKFEDNSYGELAVPNSPLIRYVPDPDARLLILLDGYEKFERILDYEFNDRSYLLQALTHASYSPNNITDCYQRLEFLGDAVLDYLITRHLYEDKRMHSPGALTDLRSALVNNTIFASLAVKYSFHKYFRYLSPGLHQVIEKFIKIQERGGHKVSEELFLLDVEESEEVEDVEVPKVLGDVFESVAGAIFLDSGRSLDEVWRVYYQMMKNEIEQFSDKVPKSPIRELLELEPETAKFGTAEKLADGRRVRVTVEVFGKGVFKGIGRNYRIAKCTAAKCALKHLKKQTLRLI